MPSQRNQAPGDRALEDRPQGNPAASLEEEVGFTIPRGRRAELRVARFILDGRPFFAIRVWVLTDHGEWIPSRKGISLRASEIVAVAGALSGAADWLLELQREGRG
jgi:hypothetical protein